MEKEVLEKAKKLIEEVPYITIASITPDGKPWNSPVFAVHDKEYNFIWNSSPDSQHSKNIEANPNIFLVIYNSGVKEGAGFGLYIQGTARKVPDGELQEALRIFDTKRGKPVQSKDEFLAGHQRLYIVTPTKCWVNLFDKAHKPADWKQEINLLD